MMTKEDYTEFLKEVMASRYLEIMEFCDAIADKGDQGDFFSWLIDEEKFEYSYDWFYRRNKLLTEKDEIEVLYMGYLKKVFLKTRKIDFYRHRTSTEKRNEEKHKAIYGFKHIYDELDENERRAVAYWLHNTVKLGKAGQKYGVNAPKMTRIKKKLLGKD